MNFNNITIGEVVGAVTTFSALIGFFWGIFNYVNVVKSNCKEIEKLQNRIDNVQADYEAKFKAYKEEYQKNESCILEKVEQTNNAVNLLCSAISVLIDHAIDGNNIKELKTMKSKLDDKKEIV